MAPVVRSKQQHKPVKSILKKPSGSAISLPDGPDDFFRTSKKDKRHIKHSQLLSKISKHEAKPRRRRPNKKLVATLDSLADALPDGDDGNSPDNIAGERLDQQVNVIKRKSLKSKPGALKRRQKLDNEERARFAKNMAQMATTTTSSPQTQSAKGSTSSQTPSRWAALRGFISQTLEKRPYMQGVAT